MNYNPLPAPGQLWNNRKSIPDYAPYEIERATLPSDFKETSFYNDCPGWKYVDHNFRWDRHESFTNGTLIFVGWAPGKSGRLEYPQEKTRLELIELDL